MMYTADFGLEKESLRIDESGFLSHTKHPFENNPNIDRDFCENQVEIVTDVCESSQKVLENLTILHNTVVQKLLTLETGKEFLWHFSNPPYVKSDDDIPVASYQGRLKSKELYRNYLAQKYGKRKMLYSGIHFNYSFGSRLLEEGFRESGQSCFRDYKDSIYLSLAQNVARYSWLIVYLTAASPVIDGSFIDDNSIGKDIIPPYSSARCSKIGYWNDFIPVLDYNSINSYADSIQRYVDSGKLKSASELYYTVRLKPKGENSLENLRAKGINHIELRMLDLNPLSPVGIKKEDIDFLNLLLIYLSSLPDEEFTEKLQTDAVNNSKAGAVFDDEKTEIEINGKRIPLKTAALRELENITEFFRIYGTESDIETLNYQKAKIFDKNKRYAEIIRQRYSIRYVEKGIKLSRAYAESVKEGVFAVV